MENESIETIVKAGTNLMMTSGEYSEFGVDGNYIVKKDFDYAYEYSEFNSENQKTYQNFKDYLMHKGLVEKMIFSEICLSSYGDAFYPDYSDHTTRVEF